MNEQGETAAGQTRQAVVLRVLFDEEHPSEEMREMMQGKLSRRRFLGSLATGVAASFVTAACGSATLQSATATIGSTGVLTTSTGASNGSAAVNTVSSVSAASSVVPSAKAGANSPASVKLSWWPGWPGKYMGDIANAFMKDNPTIKVEPDLIYPNSTKLLALLAAGTGPDVVSDISYNNFIQRGLVLPIDDLLKAEKVSTSDGDIRAANWNAFRWKGKYYGIPAVDTAGREAMGYNVDLVQQAGLDPSKLPQTWDDVYLWHQKLTKIDTAGNVQTLGLDPLYTRPNKTTSGDPWLWPEMWGFHYFDINNLKYDIDRPETIDFQTTILKFYDVGGVDKQAAFRKPLTGKYGAFGAGKQAMTIAFPSGPAEVHQANATATYQWTWVPMPANRKGVTIQTAAGHAQVLLKGSKHTAEAFALALYMTEKQACDILFDQVGWVGPSKSWQQTMDLSKFPAHVQQGIRFFITSLDQAHEVWTAAMDPESSDLGTQWRQFTDKMNHHTLDPKTAVEQLQFAMTTELKSQAGDFRAG